MGVNYNYNNNNNNKNKNKNISFINNNNNNIPTSVIVNAVRLLRSWKSFFTTLQTDFRAILYMPFPEVYSLFLLIIILFILIIFLIFVYFNSSFLLYFRSHNALVSVYVLFSQQREIQRAMPPSTFACTHSFILLFHFFLRSLTYIRGTLLYIISALSQNGIL